MAQSEVNDSVDAAEKAYAQAAQAVPVKEQAEAPVVEAVQAPVELKPEPTAPKPKAAKPAAAKPLKASAAKPAAKKAPAQNPAAKKPAAEKAEAPVVVKQAKPVTIKPVTKKAKAKLPKKAVAAKRPAAATPKPVNSSKEIPMAAKKTAGKTAGLKNFVADAKAKAQAAYAAGGKVLSEAGEFTKGNVEALAASGKIFAAGAQDLGKTYAAEAKTAIETATADVKALAAVKSPTDFFKLQGAILRRNFDDALALSSKNTKAVFKLANDTAAPISGRVSLAVSKIKRAA